MNQTVIDLKKISYGPRDEFVRDCSSLLETIYQIFI